MAAGVLPAGLTHLTFGSKFNQPLTAGVLPVGLAHLTFGREYDQPLDVGVIPAGLTHLTCSKLYRYTDTPGTNAVISHFHN